MTLMDLADSPVRTLAVELQRQLATKRDLMVDTRLVSFSEVDADWIHGDGPARDVHDVRPGLSMLVDVDGQTDAFHLTRHAHGQVAEHIGVPWKLYERLTEKHVDLFTHLANGLLNREHSKRLLRTMDGKVRAFLSNTYRPRDNWDLMNRSVLPVLKDFEGRVEFKQATLTEAAMYVKIVLPDLEKQVTPKVGDVIRGGVIIRNSEVGSGSLEISPFTDRLICLNGMVHTDFGMRARHVGGRVVEEGWDVFSRETQELDNAAFFAKCADTLRATLNETIFDSIVAEMQDLAGIRVQGPPDKVVEVFAKRHDLSGGEAGSMLEALVEGGDLSGWGYVNALTQTARDVEDADRQTELERLAGRLTHDRSWATATA